MWTQILHLRASVENLRKKHPSLADELEYVSTALETAARRNRQTRLDGISHDIPDFSKLILELETDGPNPYQLVEEYMELVDEEALSHRLFADKYRKVLDSVRQLEGFETFLQPKKIKELTSAADDGPVVCINVHKLRCDALVLFKRGSRHSVVYHIPLPKLSPSGAKKLRGQLEVQVQNHVRKAGILPTGASGSLPTILRALWDRVVWPILGDITNRVRTKYSLR